MLRSVKYRALLLIGAAFILFPELCQAMDSFKKELLEDCTKASATWSTYSPEQRKELLPFLERVLQLTPRTEPPPLIGIGQKPVPLDEPQGLNLWQTLEPGRENSAKRCTLQLLPSLGPVGTTTLPTLLKMSTDKALPDEVHTTLDSAIFNITLRTAKEKATVIDDTFFKNIIPLLSGEAKTQAQNIFIEMHEKSIPYIFGNLAQSGPNERALLFDLLPRIDTDGKEIVTGLLSLLDSADQNIIEGALRTLAFVDHVPGGLHDVSVRLLQHNESVNVQVETLTCLIARTRKEPQESKKLTPLQIRALVTSIGQTSAQVRTLFLDYLSSLLQTPLLPTAKNEIFSTASRLIYDPMLDVRLKAINLLSHQSTSSDQTVSSYLKVLNGRYPEGELRVLVLEVAKSIREMKPKPKISRLMPFFIEAFKTSPTPGSDIGNVLAGYGSESSSDVLRLTKSTELPVRIGAISLLGKIRPTSSLQISSLIELLQDNEAQIRSAAEQSITAIGPASIPELRRAIAKRRMPQSFYAAVVSLELGDKSDQATKFLRKELAGMKCLEKISAITQLLKAHTGDGNEDEAVLLECIAKEPTTARAAMQALELAVPLQPHIVEALVSIVQDKNRDPQMVKEVVRYAGKISLDPSRMIPIVFEYLREKDPNLLSSAARAIKDYDKAAAPYIKDIREIMLDLPALASERFLLAMLLLKIAPDSFDLKQIIEDALRKRSETSNLGKTYEFIRRAGVARTLTILEDLAKNGSLEVRVGSLEAIGNFGPRASAAANTLVTQLNALTPEERLASLRALLKVAPANPALITALKNTLVSRQSVDLRPQDFLGDAHAALEKVLAESDSRVIQLRAQGL